MVVIGVRFKRLGKVYYFDPQDIDIKKGDYVIVETVKGLEYGEVVIETKTINDNEIVNPIKNVIRKASEEDNRKIKENKHKECRALNICSRKIAEYNLSMNLVNVEYSFDGSKALFYFTAEGRIDFRDLVKELAGLLKTRIELRQIGVRDEARMIGGLGLCGRHLCCSSFLGDFDPVSIKMAKEQCLSLNPTKISGVCGRLMCCLKYEQSSYEEIRRRMPKLNKEVTTPKGKGIVSEINILGEKVKVKFQQGEGAAEILEFPLSSVQFQKTCMNGNGGQEESVDNGEVVTSILER